MISEITFSIFLIIGVWSLYEVRSLFSLQQVCRSGTVDINSIIGAVCIYMLLGVIWSLLYVLVTILIPGSFNIDMVGCVIHQCHDFLHFTFITLTTLGYGDIVPVGETARSLATIEAVLGQFYIAIAILVAGLAAVCLVRGKTTPNE